MIKMIISVIAIAVLASACLGQSYWKRTYGGTVYDAANAITSTPDGNFIVAGETYSFGGVGGDVYLLKIKPDGDTIWTKTYGGPGNDMVRAITPTPDGNFIVAGSTNSFGAGGNDVYLLKIKPGGDTIWTKTYGEKKDDGACAIIPTPDGNFIVAGWTDCGDVYRDDAYLLKIKPNGDMLWTKTYGGTSEDMLYAITPTPDGNFIVAGSTTSFGKGRSDIYLLKINAGGDTLWTRTYGGTSYEDAFAITQTPDGNYMVVGCTSSFGAVFTDAYLLKIKPDGDTIWAKTYGTTGDNFAYAITPTVDGNFLVVGSTSFYDYGIGSVNDDAFLLKIKPDGQTLWKKTYGGPGGDYSIAITSTPDGNYIVAGQTRFNDTLYDDVWLFSIIDDRYAYRDKPFTFKIPVSGDSLSHGYTPLKSPSGMTVSMGGTVSWTPKTDSVYMDHAEFQVSDDFGRKDTLTFNIFVNSSYHPDKIVNPVSRSTNPALHDITIQSLYSKEIRFSLPASTSSLRIYDVRGQLLENISVKGNQATWQSKRAAGRYFAKAVRDGYEMIKGFTTVR
jgi:hypothetical protein